MTELQNPGQQAKSDVNFLQIRANPQPIFRPAQLAFKASDPAEWAWVCARKGA